MVSTTVSCFSPRSSVCRARLQAVGSRAQIADRECATLVGGRGRHPIPHDVPRYSANGDVGDRIASGVSDSPRDRKLATAPRQ